MSSGSLALILVTAISISFAQPNSTQRDPALLATPNVLRGLSIASFGSNPQDSIQSLATDSSGNVYVAGTTFSANFPVTNAAQTTFGETTILRTTNLGATWTPLTNPPEAVDVIVPDPVAPQIIFATGVDGIIKSSDSGQTWQKVYAVPPQPADTPIRLVIDPGNHLHIAAMVLPSILLLSLDGGETWTPGPVGCGLPDCVGPLLADPAGTGTLVVINESQGASISRDWGMTFTPIGPALAQGGPTAAAFDPSHPGWIYLAEQFGTIALFLSTDYGATWTAKGAPSGVLPGISNIAVNPNQPSILVATAGGGFYESTDGAATWTYNAPTPAGPYLPATAPISFVVVPQACNSAGGILDESGAASFSPDYGVTWTTPQLTSLNNIAAGPGCAFYVTRSVTSNVFVAKISSDGGVLWATYLGGSDQDAPVALQLDAAGNVYVAGNTASPDFPTTVPHIGLTGENSAFVAKYSNNGALLYSVTIGGELSNSALGLATDAMGGAYLIGTTTSKQFPVTQTSIAASGTGIVAKLSPVGALSFSTYLGSAIPGAIVVDTNEEPIIGSFGAIAPNSATTEAEFVMKLDQAASQVLTTVPLPTTQARDGRAITGLAFDSQNNLVVFGQAAPSTFPAAWPTFSTGSQFCNYPAYFMPSPTAFVATLSATNWQPLSGAAITSCEMLTGGVSVGPSDTLLLSVASGPGLPLHSAMVGGPTCSTNSGGILKLGAGASTLELGSYLDTCGPPAIAVATDGSTYVGVSPPAVLRLRATNPISLDQITNAFSGDPVAVTPGGLYTLDISGFQPASANLGFTPTSALPDQLNGVEVKFDGVAAPVEAISAGQITVAAPVRFTGGSRDTPLTSVQVSYNGAASNPLWMPVENSLPGLLTTDSAGDGSVRNQDGTLNSAANPAAVGSTVTLFVTGVGATNPELPAGSIATTSGISPVTPLYSTWSNLPVPIYSIPGFVSSVFQIPIVVPSYYANLSAVTRATFQLLFELPAASLVFPASNIIGVYVR